MSYQVGFGVLIWGQRLTFDTGICSCYLYEMSRPLRIQYAGAVYHVSARGNERNRIFWERTDYEQFLNVLEKACERFSLKIYSFVLMTNHFHLMLRTDAPNLSRAMHWLKTTYTVNLNRRRRRSGHLFQGRYHSVIVENESHYLELSRYIHLNPVRARIVKKPELYEWSSCRDYICPKRRFRWVDRDTVLAELGGSGRTRYAQYRKFLRVGADMDDSAWDKIRHAVALGSDLFCEKLREKYVPDAPADILGAGQLTSCIPIKQAHDSVRRYLARRYSSHKDDRSVQMYLLHRMGYRLRDVGALFGVSYSAVSQNARRHAKKYDAIIAVDAVLSNVKR